MFTFFVCFCSSPAQLWGLPEPGAGLTDGLFGNARFMFGRPGMAGQATPCWSGSIWLGGLPLGGCRRNSLSQPKRARRTAEEKSHLCASIRHETCLTKTLERGEKRSMAGAASRGHLWVQAGQFRHARGSKNDKAHHPRRYLLSGPAEKQFKFHAQLVTFQEATRAQLSLGWSYFMREKQHATALPEHLASPSPWLISCIC